MWILIEMLFLFQIYWGVDIIILVCSVVDFMFWPFSFSNTMRLINLYSVSQLIHFPAIRVIYLWAVFIVLCLLNFSEILYCLWIYTYVVVVDMLVTVLCLDEGDKGQYKESDGKLKRKCQKLNLLNHFLSTFINFFKYNLRRIKLIFTFPFGFTLCVFFSLIINEIKLKESLSE